MAADISADLRHVLDNLPDGVIFIDRDWRITYANAQARRISRIRSQDLNGPSHWELYPATIGTEQERKYRRVMEDRVPEEDEFFYEPFALWVHWRAMPIESGIAVYYQDRTEMRRLEQDTALVTRRLQQVFDVTTDAVAALNREWQYTFLNRRAHDLLGFGDELIGQVVWHRFPDAVYPGSPYVENYYRTMNERVPTEFEAYYPEPLNKWLRLQCRPSEEGIVVFFTDITRQKLDEEAIRASAERYRILTEMNPQPIWTGTPDGLVDYANSTFMNYLGPELESKTGKEWLNAFSLLDLDRVVAAWTHSLQTGEHYCVEARMIRGSDKAERWWRVEASPVRDETGKITAWIGTGLDIHDVRMATEALKAEKAETERQRTELEVVYRTAPVGLILFEPKELRYLRANDRQMEMMGLPREAVIGKRVEEVVKSPVAVANLRKVAAGGIVKDFTYETEFLGRPGEMQAFNVNYSPVFDAEGNVRAISVAALEVTQLRKAERALLQSEKLAAVGRLASSISHEINNPLEAITNLLYLAAHDTNVENVREYVKTAQDELSRVSQIATQTLRFHRQANKPTLVTAEQLTDAVLNLYQGRLANSRVRVETTYTSATPVLCFENDIRQVLNNLIANAIDAMRTGGRLVVRAHDARHRARSSPGIRITIADTGSGMSTETLRRLFEPFYTTKGLNGTGLGLWISKEIVERHHGELRVRSSQNGPLHGTIFTLFLPVEMSA
jgi:PAS domain S-box-containing protein